MDLAIQILMGVSLAACAGMRAFLPILVVGALARTHHLELSPHFAFLARTDTLIVFGVATVLEFLGDKIIAVDHVLDAAGMVVRPVAGTLLATSLLTKLDPLTATVLGIVVGGGTALTIHSGKAAARYSLTAAAPLHAGMGNAATSLIEDLLVGVNLAMTVVAPIVAFIVTVGLIATAVWLLTHVVRLGKRGLASLRRGGAPPAA